VVESGQGPTGSPRRVGKRALVTAAQGVDDLFLSQRDLAVLHSREAFNIMIVAFGAE
jgi:hypothetical protein